MKPILVFQGVEKPQSENHIPFSSILANFALLLRRVGAIEHYSIVFGTI
jgi:hypothetical protein